MLNLVSKIYINVTTEWLRKSDTSYKKVVFAKKVKRNNKIYKVNSVNRIILENREKENGEWFVNMFGGRLEYLPNINEDDGVPCADYKYYPPNSTKWYFLEEKETKGKGKNVFYHAFEDSEMQSNIFLLDCTDSNLTDYEIMQRLEIVFSSRKTKYVKIIIVKNKKKLFGVYKKRSDLSGIVSGTTSYN